MTSSPLPFPVRFTDMRDAERHYQSLTPDARLEAHDHLRFFHLLADEERAALQRRFPRELAADPLSPRATAAVRTAWDFRSRELVVCMLHFGEQVLARRLDLVGALGPASPLGAMALTVSGSIVDLGPPDAAGARHWAYRPGVRRDHKAREGKVALTGPLAIGLRVDLGRLTTSEVLVLAAGDLRAIGGPAADLPEGTRLFTPAEDTAPGARESDDYRLEMTRFRVLVDAMGNAFGAERTALQDRAVEVACAVQAMLALGRGLALGEVAELVAVTGTRYRVDRTWRGKTKLERFPQGRTHSTTLADVRIGAQRVVRGAPLVLLGPGRDALGVIFEVTAITPR